MSDNEQKSPLSGSGGQKTGSQIAIHFIKSANFRVIHANGAWFGGDAQQNLHLTFYNERMPIPKKVVLNVNEQGAVISEDESQRDMKQGVIREMEVDVVLSIPAALELHNALVGNLKMVGAIKS